MLSRIVDAFKVFDVDDTASILIKSSEGKQDLRLSAVVHFTHNGSKEIIIVDGSARISVEESENSLNLTLVSGNSIVLHGFGKFAEIESLRLVIVHNFEDSADSIDASHATCGHFLPQR